MGTDALERLFRDHYREVFASAYRITGDAMAAEDVLQTVFCRVADRAQWVFERPEPGRYLRRAAVNAALDLARARSRRAGASLESLASHGGSGGQDSGLHRDGARVGDRTAGDRTAAVRVAPSAETLSDDAALRESLRSAVAGLSPMAGEAFALRYFEGFSNSEIADLLGSTPSSIGVTLYRARLALRRALAGDGYGPATMEDDDEQ